MKEILSAGLAVEVEVEVEVEFDLDLDDLDPLLLPFALLLLEGTPTDALASRFVRNNLRTYSWSVAM